MFSSLRARLWLSYAFVISMALGIVSVVLLVYLVRNPVMTRNTLQELSAVMTKVQESPQRFILNPSAFTSLSQDQNIRMVVFNSSREVVVDTAPDKPSIPFPHRTLLNRSSQIVFDSAGNAWLYRFARLQNGQVLAVAAPRPHVPVINIFKDELFTPIIQAGIVALLLSLVLAFVLSRWVADPLQRVVNAAHEYPARENLPVKPQGPREVQEVARAFNSMVKRVETIQRSQKDFIANVSHELKTPLTSIQGFAQAILDDTADTPESRKQAARVIYTESDRLHRMALDLLDLARFEAGTVEMRFGPVDMTMLVRGITEKFTPFAEKAGVELSCEVAKGIPTLQGDGDRLAQVLSNLVDNALKFTPAGGKVMLSAKTAGAELEISVADTGIGVEEEALPHLFERFYQADKSRPGGVRHGTGLGLAIVKEIVEAHGGKIGVRSRAGGGSVFTVRLPSVKR